MNNTKRSFSVIMTVYDQAQDLRENLPLYLTQEYDDGYEVIVVDETSTDETPDVLKLLKEDYPHLYTTFLPKPNRLAIRKKISNHIGIKAAKNDWIIITKVNKKPMAQDILKAIAENIPEGTELTLGYIKKKSIRLQFMEDSQDAKDFIRKTERILTKVRDRKRMKYIMGRYDFMIFHKDQAYEILKYFEEKISAPDLLGIRIRIFFKNLFRRFSTVKLVVN